MLQNDFDRYLAKTTPHPMGLAIQKASGSYLWDTDGKKYLDFVAGVSACSVGHCNPRVVRAIQQQSEAYLHVMVYGEFAQKPVTELAKKLLGMMPDNHQKIYLTNSGTEAIEGALKLAKRATNRSEIVAAKNSYHGSTQGALSVTGYEPIKNAYRPLLPNIRFVEYNNTLDLEQITTKTAAVILETIQGGAGFIMPKNDYLQKVKARCETVGALLILDEIQPGFGRTGTLFGFEQFGVIPDIVVMGKGMGGGIPIGAFTASDQLMDQLAVDPALGHITTFGGHPLIAAAALATLEEITASDLMKQIAEKEALIRNELKHPKIKQINGCGLMLAPILDHPEIVNQLVLNALDEGLILFWLLWEKRAIRISPPLTITKEELYEGCQIIRKILNQL
ncbi:MAG: aspartate aminotransferase family protein [Bacteroidetes bacterium]|nr:aspartate aminotransferase family protein [Bacteroidota bacterium]MDA0938580.1 aspartate aminotransferase family protein [Bacteroidota bacterium]MDA1344971.1 aspartate aminotransferase family protein [Bacteroidota bacterium]